ncbi:DNA starvation/stationary phase protection protein [Caulobacter sp. SLTY]|uniref:Dps family protein n=1 Tax=Caulobacter sp. SLTY TaxID=2683262 RepID=UPI001412D51E|nr:Dps family protein [Caulobacter sp. SLTY]NBB17350.1 DNA starvation/stationary phase protection protein [Caulobacter sp. SLTY]
MANKSEPVVEALNKALADSYAAYLKTHGYHWNVRGPNFSSYHNLFMTQYTEMWTALDVIAERIRTLGAYAPQGYATFANLTSIKDGDPDQSAEEMIRELVRDHGVVADTLRAALKDADAAGDDVTVDLMTQRLAAHEKHAWMLRATLGDK